MGLPQIIPNLIIKTTLDALNVVILLSEAVAILDVMNTVQLSRGASAGRIIIPYALSVMANQFATVKGIAVKSVESVLNNFFCN